MAQPTYQVTLRIPPQIHDQLEKRVSKTGENKNQVIVDALKDYLKKV